MPLMNYKKHAHIYNLIISAVYNNCDDDDDAYNEFYEKHEQN